MNKELSPNSNISHYRIVRKIGAGGMGEVYLAEDTKLERKVALKILPADVALNQERMRRFVQEAKAASSLNHPCIAHIYEIGEADGVNFIAMEFVEGVSLREKIHGERVDLRTLLKYLAQVAEGLAKAHAAGIVHRDLKPENIMISRDGYAKILDFGLAKLIGFGIADLGLRNEETETLMQAPSNNPKSQIPNPKLTSPGMIMGTVGYMSPEQAQGKNEIDQRSDIFSFGCVLFEAATGRQPFSGDSVIDSLHKIIHAHPTPICDFNPHAPLELQRIVRRCLAKDPDERYQTIKDAGIELKELRSEMKAGSEGHYSISPPEVLSVSDKEQAVATKTIAPAHSTSSAEYVVTEIKRHKLAALVALFVIVIGAIGLGFYLHARNTEVAIESIAVLPFENKDSDSDMEYLSDGLAESLIYRLSQLPNLKVSPRSLVFRYKGKEADPIKVGGELSVNAVLSGRIIQRGDNLTISVELVDVRNNQSLWGEQYERKMSDLLQTQREIAREIVEKLKLKVTGEEKAIAKRYTENNEAYQLYLKGRFYWNKRNAEALKKSVEYFNQAIEKDPNFALAYSGLADTYITFHTYSISSPLDSVPQAKAAARRALELDDTLAEAHTTLACALAQYDWNLTEAEKEFRRAFELNPNYATAHQWYGTWYMTAAGRLDDAIAELKRAAELDPLSLIINSQLGEAYLHARQYDKAIEQLRKTVELDQSFYRAQWQLGVAYAAQGNFNEAIAVYRQARTLNDDPHLLALQAHALALSGKRDEALRMLEQLKEIAKQRYVQPHGFVYLYAALGDKDKAFEWLERAYQVRAAQMVRLKFDPLLDPLRDDPRFADLVRRVGLPQ